MALAESILTDRLGGKYYLNNQEKKAQKQPVFFR
jgi:hypothetical protein